METLFTIFIWIFFIGLLLEIIPVALALLASFFAIWTDK